MSSDAHYFHVNFSIIFSSQLINSMTSHGTFL